MSPLGETLQRARLSKGITFEDAERVTRIPRRYLEALEVENFGALPAPVFARGFLRSYASYLGLDPGELLPFFPVGHVEEPALEPLPDLPETRTWNASGLIAVGVVGALILLVIALYSVGAEESSPVFSDPASIPEEQQAPPVALPDTNSGGAGLPAIALPDFKGQTLDEAIAIVEGTGASYVVVGTQEGDFPPGQVIDQRPAPGTEVGPGDSVTLTYSTD